ncbi:MAG: hypothetical protein QNJ74_14665 [Trichodesmium sp. MO_231.B1]|nr:hypothetical protein [Trichodesmium sp. MO_231.B1]
MLDLHSVNGLANYQAIVRYQELNEVRSYKSEVRSGFCNNVSQRAE